ncbi:hypothetical protein RISW2_18890 [Roseivivax isoporae LMG 25204]|uniref:Uncharacterized protein n=1 Tax=Roseivivax isoporae LMG 25204 TaxID=1449351 RepID=X7F464_9RHOB|nr:hypothetical protein RISW2_18890 [Roseivivax isoporae LMG 25204]
MLTIVAWSNLIICIAAAGSMATLQAYAPATGFLIAGLTIFAFLKALDRALINLEKIRFHLRSLNQHIVD